jgi:tetratricopeptide (TPR) repeat protein
VTGRRPASLVILLLAAAALAVAGNLLRDDTIQRRIASEDRSDDITIPSPRVARFLSLGYNELAADLAWARTLVYYGDGMQRRTELRHVERLTELVNTLDPHFRRPYWWAAYAVTYRQKNVTDEELRSSVKVLERAVEVFPNDWEMHWLLGTRYFLDIKSDDPREQEKIREKGAAYIERAMRLPNAPTNLPILAASMRTKLGQRERALRALEEMILTQTDDAARKELEERYAALASEDAREAMSEAATEFQARWKQHLPFAPPSLYILLGPRPSGSISLSDIAEGERFEAEPEPAPDVAPDVAPDLR